MSNGISKVQKYDSNPFVEKAIEDIKIIKKTQLIKSKERSEVQMIVSNDGELVGHSTFMRFVEVEEEKFAKIYLSQFQAFWDLKTNSIRVFGYIINHLPPNKDMFILYMDQALEYTKYKYAKEINAGLVGLIESGIIARAKYENHYYINPLVVFNGNRVTFANTYIKKKTKKVNPSQTNLFLDETI
jgi:predicted transcriptional regulator